MLLTVAVRPLPGKYSKLSTETDGRSLPSLWSTTALQFILQKRKWHKDREEIIMFNIMLYLYIRDGITEHSRIELCCGESQQQQQRLIPLGGVGYIVENLIDRN